MNIRSLWIGLVLFFGIAPAAFAARTDFTEMFLTDTFGSLAPEGDITNPFEYDDTPWVYLKPSQGSPNDITSTLWAVYNFPGGFLGQTGSDQTEYWLKHENWPLVRGVIPEGQQGLFQVTSAACYDGDGCPDANNSNYDFGSALFYVGGPNATVTPEPVSAALFALGGVGLAGIKRFRRKK